MSNDLNQMRIGVTGGAGFLGRPVVRRLQARGAQVFVPRSCEFDLRTEAGVRAFYQAARPRMVIHLAAVVGGIGANQVNPGRFLYDNAMMALQIIEQGRVYGLEKFVGLGTICAYPKYTPVPFQESELWNGYPEETNAPYGLAKKLMLVQLQAYRRQYGLNGIYLLPVNLYGPGDNFDPETSHVIPAMIRKFWAAVARGDGSVTLWGTGNASREFLFVEDCAEAIVLAAERYNAPEPVNIGNGREISIRDLAAMIADAVGFQGEIVWDASRPDGQPRRCLDIARAQALFGFRAGTSFESGLRQTVAWWRDSVHNSNNS